MTRLMGAVLIGAALAVAGCGGDDDGGGGGEPLAKADLVKEANAICKEYSEKGDALKAPENISDPKQASAYFNSATDLAQDQQDELEALEPADDVKADYDALTKATGDATKLLGDLASAAESEDAEKGAELIGKLQPASNAVDKASAALGTTACASA